MPQRIYKRRRPQPTYSFCSSELNEAKVEEWELPPALSAAEVEAKVALLPEAVYHTQPDVWLEFRMLPEHP